MKICSIFIVVFMMCWVNSAHADCSKKEVLQMIDRGFSKAEIDEICNEEDEDMDGEDYEDEKPAPRQRRRREPETGDFCCDIFGNRRCGGNTSLPLGSPCFCPFQGQGYVCK